MLAGSASRVCFVQLVCAAALLLCRSPGSAGEVDCDGIRVEFAPGDYRVDQGSTVTLPINVTGDELATGFSFGAIHDDATLELVDVDATSRLMQLIDSGGDFFEINTNPAGGSGFYVAALFGPESNPGQTLPAGTSTVLQATYRAAVTASGSTTLTITGGLRAQGGAPEVQLVVDVGGEARPFCESSTMVTFVEVVPFIRGDADDSGGLNISDGVAILGFLFLGDGSANRDCLVSLNTNGSLGGGISGREDVADISLDDAITVFNFLFAGGAPPFTPYPDCGISPNDVDDSIECTRSTCGG